MPKETILVVEDEHDINELITYNLKREGYNVHGVTSGEDALTHLGDVEPDLVVLDLMLPGLDGLDVCKEIKTRNKETSVIILTAKDGEADVVTGLELGADDYMTKPFSPRVLKARVKAVLRRSAGTEAPPTDGLEAEGIYIHSGKREVRIDGKPVTLTNMEFKILHFLASRRGWAFTRSQIVAAIRGEGFAVTDRSVDTLIVGLRKKLGEHAYCIETVRSVGYRFKE